MELTEEQIQENWKKYKQELKNLKVENMDSLIRVLSDKDFDIMPASSSGKYHGGYRGGLVVHCLTMLELHRKMGKKFENDRIELCILLHDVGKLEGYKQHGSNSIKIICNCIFLNETEEHAILYHMGMYGAKKRNAQDIPDYSLWDGYMALEKKFTKYLSIIDDYSSNFIEE